MGLLENMAKEPVSQLALREPVLCLAQDTLRTAVEQMRARNLGCAIVVDDDKKPVGMFSESMLTRLLAHGPAPLDEPISDHMAEQWPWVKLSESIVDILDAMHVKNVRFICVVDDDGRVAALAGQKGLMEYIAEHFPSQVMVQRVGCAPVRDREGA